MPSDSLPRRTLVLGGARSGKSAVAEAMFGDDAVRYVATARRDTSDADFEHRIAAHRIRRPQSWTVVENQDLVDTLATGAGPTLVDDIGTWLTDRIDAEQAWESPRGTVDTDPLVSAVADYPGRLVVVSPEVGLGVVPATRSGRLFRDEIGVLNQRLAQACDEVLFVIAGLTTRLK
ncbi:bifunctional adenosylcobinamide kinase/adenosylcobinamide-phosphate guanylyltransferase [Antrihabitans stalagmiti]|uniref:bifunctional adenosylcobinamide kinase/adenosylcobinamide-phosphate guanylyltransferase n=1 Tax=Antrihabitans stalagmiti TaxID=2799499 RepID=UPI003FD71662